MNDRSPSFKNNKTVLLLGSSGLLGCTLKPILESTGYSVVTHSRSKVTSYQVDLTDSNKTAEFLNEIKPEIIVNLVGLTDVDLCETNPNKAYLLNVRVIENIAIWIKKVKPSCHLVQLSTDQVYDGVGLHDEKSISLKNYYAFSKYTGELAAIRVASTVLRTNFIGRSQSLTRSSLTDWLYNSLSNKESIQVFDDVQFNPLSMTTLSNMISLIILNKPLGVFNLGSHEGMSKADFAFVFAKELKLPTACVTRTTTDKVSFLKTYRPKNMLTNCSKFENILNVKLPSLKDEITQVAREYINEA